MTEIMEKLKQVNRILTGEEGPQLTSEYAEDARYTYPERISLALRVLAEMEYLLTNQSSRPDNARCVCPNCGDIHSYKGSGEIGCGKSGG